jgi:hypothetical protein
MGGDLRFLAAPNGVMVIQYAAENEPQAIVVTLTGVEELTDPKEVKRLFNSRLDHAIDMLNEYRDRAVEAHRS